MKLLKTHAIIFFVLMLLFKLFNVTAAIVHAAEAGGQNDSHSAKFNPFCQGTSGIQSSFGCIIINSPQDFVSALLAFTIGIAGGIAFLLIILGGLQIMAATGNPEKMTAGKELMTSAIVGLLMILFSVFLLRLIGYDILGIPGFG